MGDAFLIQNIKQGPKLITNKLLFPTQQGNAAIYTTTWVPSVNNLSSNHQESTFIVPSGVYSIRCIAYGSGSQGGNASNSQGGFVDAILPCTPGQFFKVIVPDIGIETMSSGRGGHGCGGGAGPDGNSNGVGGAGAAIASIVNPLTKGLVVAGGGGTGSGHGSGGDGFDGNNTTGTGALSNGTGGKMYRANGSTLNGGNFGFGGTISDDGYGAGYVAGSGGGAGAGGGASDTNLSTSVGNGQNANANSWGGRGGQTLTNAPGAGGTGTGDGGDGGNGFVLDGDPIGGGGGAGHGTAQGGGGFAGGGAAYCCSNFGGGGGSGTVVNALNPEDVVQDKYVNPTNILTSQGNLLNITGQSGPGRSTTVPTNRGSFAQNGMCIIMW